MRDALKATLAFAVLATVLAVFVSLGFALVLYGFAMAAQKTTPFLDILRNVGLVVGGLEVILLPFIFGAYLAD